METNNAGPGEPEIPGQNHGQPGPPPPPPFIPVPPPPPAAQVLPLYSELGISIASFFGGGFALGYFMSRNFRRLGNASAANNYLLGGIFGAFLCALFLASLTEAGFGEIRNYFLIIQALWAIAAFYLFQSAQGKQVEEQIAAGNNRYSPLPGLIGLSIGFCIINLFVILFFGIYISY